RTPLAAARGVRRPMSSRARHAAGNERWASRSQGPQGANVSLMPDRPDPRARMIGAPPTAARPSSPLAPTAVAVMLTARSVPALLQRLGVSAADRAELRGLLPQTAADAGRLAAGTETANLLRTEAGLDAEPAPLGTHADRLNALQERLRPGQGLLMIAAHLVSTDVVRSWHRARGLSDQQSWQVLSDL